MLTEKMCSSFFCVKLAVHAKFNLHFASETNQKHGEKKCAAHYSSHNEISMKFNADPFSSVVTHSQKCN